MSARRVLLAALIVILASAPAWANPKAMPMFELFFFPPVALLGIAVFALPALGGVKDVHRRLFPDSGPPSSGGSVVCFIVLAVLALVSPLSFFALPVLLVGLVVFALARAIQMLLWGARAFTEPRPPHLVGIRPSRMMLCGFLLLVMIPTSFVASTEIPLMQTSRSRMPRAISEIKMAEQVLARLASDAGVKDLHDLFSNPNLLLRPTLAETVDHQTDIVLELLARGRNARVGVKAELKPRLQTSYVRLQKDPWGRRYLFFLGPWKDDNRWGYTSVPFRSYRESSNTLGMKDYPPDDYTVTVSGKRFGIHASRDIPVYIFSRGQDRVNNQAFSTDEGVKPEDKCGRDDINNWDSNSGWSEVY